MFLDEVPFFLAELHFPWRPSNAGHPPLALRRVEFFKARSLNSSAWYMEGSSNGGSPSHHGFFLVDLVMQEQF